MERFVYWGVFAVFGAILVAYVIWLVGVEWSEARRRKPEARRRRPEPPESETPAEDGPSPESPPAEEDTTSTPPDDEGPARTFWGPR